MRTTPLKVVQPEIGQSRYAALAAALRARVVAGEWPPGSALPAEDKLAQDHQVALGTMRRALELLAGEGLIERIHGRGTFVRAGLTGAPMLRFFRFGDRTGEVPVSRITARSVVAAPADIARRLGIAQGESALRLHRMRLLDGTPVLLEEIWLPMDLFADLAEDDPAQWGPLLYPMLSERFGVHVHRAVDEISFGVLSAARARQLDLAPGHPCALVTRSTFDVAGRCVEVRQSRGDANAFHYTVTIT